MKKLIALFAALLLAGASFAQTKVDAKKLAKALESNKDSSAVFVSELDLSGMKVADDGKINLPLFAKSKAIIVAGMDMANIKERIEFANKKSFTVTFETQFLSSKRYMLTNIEGIESVAECVDRLKREAKEKWEQERRVNLLRLPVQVVSLDATGLLATEAAWLPGQVRGQLKFNLQEYLGMNNASVDAESEPELKKVFAQAKGAASDKIASEFAKVTDAKFALFEKVKKTAKGYSISADFMDLTTGEKLASVSSNEYTKSDYLCGPTGAADQITLAIAKKLDIKMSDLNQNLLASGSANFNVDQQLALAEQNEAQYKKLAVQLDSELSKLGSANDFVTVENKRKIEAQKALLIEKQSAERKRQEDLRAQKERESADARLEAERSIELKTLRDKMAKAAASKAAELRKLKYGKDSSLLQINVLESKKGALVDIRNSVEARCQELFAQMQKNRSDAEERIRSKAYSTVELGSDGQPTEAAKTRRDSQALKSYQDLTNKFFVDCDAVKVSAQPQDSALLAEIRADQKSLAAARTVSSMGDELKVSFGPYEGSKNGWVAYLSLYSDGVLLYTDSFIVRYDAISGKKAPDMKTELNDAVIKEYTDNVDMYSSLLTRGDPIVYFEIDYTVGSDSDENPSVYNFNFIKIRVIDTVGGKIVQASSLSKKLTRTMQPAYDLRIFAGVEEKEKAMFEPKKYPVEKYMAEGMCKTDAEKKVAADKELGAYITNYMATAMVKIPGKNIKMMSTEVTQRLYQRVMGENPSNNKGLSNPVEEVSWYDAVYFCNVMSERAGYEPVYSVNGETDVAKWDYTPHKEKEMECRVEQNEKADGFRLPTIDEWEYAAKGGQDFKYSGSNNLDAVGWYQKNSGEKTHPVAQKRPNGYGLYDMCGNVWEWVWDASSSNYRYHCGGSFYNADSWVSNRDGRQDANNRCNHLGFRVARFLAEGEK